MDVGEEVVSAVAEVEEDIVEAVEVLGRRCRHDRPRVRRVWVVHVRMSAVRISVSQPVGPTSADLRLHLNSIVPVVD